MRVLFVSNLYPPNVVGGYERLCADVAAAFVARNHDVAVLTSNYGRTVSRHPGQIVHQALQLRIADTIYATYSGSERQLAALDTANRTAALRVIGDFRPEVIFCWNLYALDPSLLDTLIASGVPVVLMLTDNWLIAAENPDFIDWYFRTQVFRSDGAEPQPAPGKTVAGRARLCAALFGSVFMRDLYAQAGLAFERTTVVHNGVRQSEHDAADYADRMRLAKDGEFNLLVAGRLVSLKGVHTAIEALAALTGCRLTIVGDRQDRAYVDRLLETAARHGVSHLISLREPVGEDELFDLFQSFDAYLFPSIYEPFSLTLIIALAAGIPTVASRVGGNLEIVANEQVGLLFDKEDADGLARAIRSLMDRPDLRVRLSANGRIAAAEFTYERMVAGMEAFLAELKHSPAA